MGTLPGWARHQSAGRARSRGRCRTSVAVRWAGWGCWRRHVDGNARWRIRHLQRVGAHSVGVEDTVGRALSFRLESHAAFA
eukprot:1141799-Prymnesium_polylepis.2